MSALNTSIKNQRKLSKEALQEICVLGLLVALCIYFSFASPYFHSINNYLNMLRQMTVSAVIACGMNFILLVGGIDLSVGSVVAVAGVVAAEISILTKDMFLTILAVLLTGVLIGFINGTLIVKFRIPPFIVTLAMMSILRGGVMVYTNSNTYFGLMPRLMAVGQGYIGIIPIPVIIMVVIFIISIFILSKTRFGLHVYAVGGNEEVSRLSGINTKAIMVCVYIICGTLAALAGLITTARTAAATPTAGQGYELDAITAVVLGGTNMNGGSGSLAGTLAGVAVLTVLTNGLTMLNINVYWVQIIKGIILLVAIIVSVKAATHERK